MDLDAATFSPAGMLDAISVNKSRLENAQERLRLAVGLREQAEAEVYRRYEERLQASNALDFDDLLVKTIEVFRNCPQALLQYRETYKHVLVDEYQDTNLPQHLIVRALQGKHRNLTAVGDPDQMIYTWRGARLENILEFEKDFPGAHIIKLEYNYRSTANILKAASVCISFNRLRHEKILWTESDPGKPVSVLEFEDSYAEADWIANKAQELIKDGVSPNEIAVLYRTKYQSLPLEDAFASRTLPYQVVDTVGFFERKPVKDLRAYMRLLVNPRDDEAFLRIANVPTRGIGQATLERLQALARQARKPVFMLAREASEVPELGARAKAALRRFCELYDRLSSLDHESVYSFLKQLVELTGYVEAAPAEEREDVEEVVDYLLGYAKQYDHRTPGRGLIGFLEQTALISDVDGWNPGARAVSFMTLHSAKGLEFDVAVITGLEEETLPHRRSLEENPYGDVNYGLEEERRLLHVGMTRARTELYLTHARVRIIRGREQLVSPSRFLRELPSEGVVWESQCHKGTSESAAGFDQEADYVVKQKRAPLKPVNGGDHGRIAPGVEIVHPSYGQGTVISVDSAGKHHLVRIDFHKHGVLTLLL
jgi:DNA helicase-2/ATP-dependent DNA helicase PcrA